MKHILSVLYLLAQNLASYPAYPGDKIQIHRHCLLRDCYVDNFHPCQLVVIEKEKKKSSTLYIRIKALITTIFFTIGFCSLFCIEYITCMHECASVCL